MADGAAKQCKVAHDEQIRQRFKDEEHIKIEGKRSDVGLGRKTAFRKTLGDGNHEINCATTAFLAAQAKGSVNVLTREEEETYNPSVPEATQSGLH